MNKGRERIEGEREREEEAEGDEMMSISLLRLFRFFRGKSL